MKLQSKHFSLDSEVEVQSDILEILEDVLFDYLKLFKLKNCSRINIYLYKNQDRYAEAMYQMGEEISQYSKGSFNPHNRTINHVYNEKTIENDLKHELIHLLYYEVYEDKYQRILWLDEGLAQNLSTKKMSEEEFKIWYLSRIERKDKQIPPISFLKQHGTNYGEFIDLETNSYNGYDLSYAMVRYLIDVYGKSHLSNFLQDQKQIFQLESTILESMHKYYSKLFKIKDIKGDINDIKTPEQILNYISLNIKSGWYDEEQTFHFNGSRKTYKTMSLEDAIAQKIGTSFEKTLLASAILTKLKIKNKIVVDQDTMMAYPVFKQLDWKQLNWKTGIVPFYESENMIEIPEIKENLTFEELKEYVLSFKEEKQK